MGGLGPGPHQKPCWCTLAVLPAGTPSMGRGPPLFLEGLLSAKDGAMSPAIIWSNWEALLTMTQSHLED